MNMKWSRVKKLYRQFKPFIAVTLFVQSASLLVLFFLLYRKKKSIANTFLTLAGVSAAIGGFLFWQEYGAALGLRSGSGEDDEPFELGDMDLSEEMLNPESWRENDVAREDGPRHVEILSEDSSEEDFRGI